jgi:GR25 family glycosyltransferase involved in LPS biosynthesis
MLRIINSFLLCSPYEQHRFSHINTLQDMFPGIVKVEAIFPKYQNVPFLQKLINLSEQRTGIKLMPGEIGCLLGHRKIWKTILNSKDEYDGHYLVLESDSKINDIVLLKNTFHKYSAPYDIFFWGAWEGDMRIKKSTIIFNEHNRVIGEPLLNSIYCTYGYSLNKAAAGYLLNQTNKISFPVDFFKKFIQPNTLRIGGIRNELISICSEFKSSIRTPSIGSRLKHFLMLLILNVKNKVQAYFS